MHAEESARRTVGPRALVASRGPRASDRDALFVQPRASDAVVSGMSLVCPIIGLLAVLVPVASLATLATEARAQGYPIWWAFAATLWASLTMFGFAPAGAVLTVILSSNGSPFGLGVGLIVVSGFVLGPRLIFFARWLARGARGPESDALRARGRGRHGALLHSYVHHLLVSVGLGIGSLVVVLADGFDPSGLGVASIPLLAGLAGLALTRRLEAETNRLVALGS